jgi:hypothetical protein
MRADVLVEADLQQGQVDDPVVERMLNEQLGELYELIVQSYEGYYSASADFTLAVGEDAEDLPIDFYQATDVEDLADPANPASLVGTFEFKDRNRVFDAKRWCVHGGQVVIRPSGSAPGNYRLTYVPAFQDLNPDDNFDAPNNWHVYAVLGVAARLRSTQELGPGDLEDRRKAVAQRIANAARKRQGPRKVRDVRPRFGAFARPNLNDGRYGG